MSRKKPVFVEEFFHARLRSAREEKGYDTAADAARAIGVPESTYRGHENGTTSIASTDDACQYALFFDVNLDWLLLNRGPMRPATAKFAQMADDLDMDHGEFLADLVEAYLRNHRPRRKV